MHTLFALVVESPDGAKLDPGGVAVAEVIERLAGGEAADRVARSLDLSAAEMIAALAFHALGPDGGEGPSLVQSRPALPALEACLAAEALAGLFPGAAEPATLALAAGLLQIHDFWDDSHHAAQRAEDLGERDFSAYWHAIAHRREPDFGNAAYWFRRVDRHPLFTSLAEAAPALLNQSAVSDRIAPDGLWDPFAFLEFCGSARPGERAESRARRMQRVELALLLDATVQAVLPAG